MTKRTTKKTAKPKRRPLSKAEIKAAHDIFNQGYKRTADLRGAFTECAVYFEKLVRTIPPKAWRLLPKATRDGFFYTHEKLFRTLIYMLQAKEGNVIVRGIKAPPFPYRPNGFHAEAYADMCKARDASGL